MLLPTTMVAYSSLFRYSIEVDGCTHKLTIPEVTLKDGGAVSYSIEKLSTEATLTVDGTFKPDNITLKVLVVLWTYSKYRFSHLNKEIHKLDELAVTVNKIV